MKHLLELNSGLQQAKYLQNELKNRCRNQREILDFLTSLTTSIHEIRHWHDYVGTMLGFEIFWIFTEYYSRTMHVLRYLAQNNIILNLPLKRTFYAQATDVHLNEFADFNIRRKNFIYSKLFQESNVSSDIRQIKKNNKVLYLKDIPFLEFDAEDKFKYVFLRDVPITGISLFESLAVLTEVYSIFDMIGDEEAQLYMKKRFEHPNLWLYNSVIKSLVMANSNVSIELMLSIISNSVTYYIGSNSKECNPASRFIAFRNELASCNYPPITLEDIEEWVLEVIEKNGWSDNKKVAREQIRFCEAKIKAFESVTKDESRDLDSLEDYIILYLKEHIKYMKRYECNVLFWASEYFYYSDHSNPPIKQIYVNRDRKWQFNSEAHLRWFSLTSIIDQLFKVNREQFRCPFKGSKICNLQSPDCGKLPLKMPPEHPECWYLVTACEILAPNWDFG
ncbi:MAG: hypothetical protein FH756_20695 [Firmicutes bacterium]|nr:hypothetical protein [Bacillota bacterium]